MVAIAVVPEVRRLKLEDAEFKMGMDDKVRPCWEGREEEKGEEKRKTSR